MHVEIHGALVGGAVGGAVVLLGILLDHLVRERASMRKEARDAIRRIAVLVPRLLGVLSDSVKDQTGTPTQDPVWQQRSDDLQLLLGVIYENASAFRGTERIRDAADAVTASTFLLTNRFMTSGWQKAITFDELLAVSSKVQRLHELVAGEREPLSRDQLSSV